MYFVLIMQKVQTGLVIEFYSNSCLVRTDKKDIPCIGIKDIIVGDIVKIEILQDSKETKGVILSREVRKSLLQKKDEIKYKNIAANLSHVGILVTPKPKTTAEFIDKWILTSLLSGIEPFVICNKSDLNHDDAYLKQINLYKSLDIQTVIVTLGSEGALLVSGDQTELVSSPVVESVDTTGAGDAFCGSVAESLSRGLSFLESVEHSVTAGALSTTTYGAQISMPTRSEVDSFLGEI